MARFQMSVLTTTCVCLHPLNDFQTSGCIAHTCGLCVFGERKMEDSHLIKEGDRVVIRKDRNIQCVEIKTQKKCNFDRMSFKLDGAIGQPFGSVFEVAGGEVVRVEREQENDGGELNQEKDNRDLQDTSENQKLTHDDVLALKKQGVSGQDIIEKLVENSATFNTKTEFAQKKYLNRKKKKHLSRMTVFRPSTRLLAEMYFNKSAQKICYLRLDSLSQVLTLSNVRANSRFLVMESCVGLLIGACLERMGGHGQLVQIHTGVDPVRTAVHNYGFPQEFYDSLYQFPLHLVSTLKKSAAHVNGSLKDTVSQAANEDETQMETMEQDAEAEKDSENSEDSDGPPKKKRKGAAKEKNENSEERNKWEEERRQLRKQRKNEREEKMKVAKSLMEQGEFDGLIVATRLHPSPVVMSLIDLVASDRKIVVFCSNREPLVDLYQRLRNRGGVVNMTLTDTWWRHYQVLPNRTHPSINMSSDSGYILSGITVAQPDSKQRPTTTNTTSNADGNSHIEKTNEATTEPNSEPAES